MHVTLVHVRVRPEAIDACIAATRANHAASVQAPGNRLWLEEAALPNMPTPIVLDINDPWPCQRFHAVFGANTLFVLARTEVERMYAGLATVLSETAKC